MENKKRLQSIAPEKTLPDLCTIRSIILRENEKTVIYSCVDFPIELISVFTDAFAHRFPGWTLVIENEGNTQEEDEQSLQQLIVDTLLHEMPSLQVHQEIMNVRVEETKFYITLPSVSMDRFIGNDVENIIVRKIQSQFGQKYETCECIIDSIEIEEEIDPEELGIFESVVVQNTQAKQAVFVSDNYNMMDSYAKDRDWQAIPVVEISTEDRFSCIDATISSIEKIITTKQNRKIYTFDVYDSSGSTACKFFCSSAYDEKNKMEDALKVGKTYRLIGQYQYDNFAHCDVLTVFKMTAIEKQERMDEATEKRVELHLHTMMSATDGLIDTGKLFDTLARWGHRAVAITDHAVVQAYPDVANLSKSHGIKPLYGMEAYVVDDRPVILKHAEDINYNRFVVFDLETTGLSHLYDEIIEIGAVKIEDGRIVDRFSTFVNPQRPLHPEITELTGIHDYDLTDAPLIESVLPAFLAFSADSVFVAHNADFDIGFIRRDAMKLGLPWGYPSFDTLSMAQLLFPDQRGHRLDRMAKQYGISLDNHHRAVDDAEATAELFLKLLDTASIAPDAVNPTINAIESERNPGRGRATHINVLVQNNIGLRHLYDMVSSSHLDTFYMTPKIPKSLLKEKREGLLLGTSCTDGPVLQAILGGATDEEMIALIKEYDYVELQPVENWGNLFKNRILPDEHAAFRLQQKIYSLSKEAGIPVVATSDAHFLNREDLILRQIVKRGRKMVDPKDDMPFFLRTTDEMLASFSHLGEEVAHEIVVENTNAIADSIESIVPILPGTHPPHIEGSDKELKEMVYTKARSIYGDSLPEIVEARLERELNSIITHGYAVLYIIAQKLVQKSNDDGYLVGSRGSVGSSFVATMSGITEVNPLIPHYICKSCHFSEFIDDGIYDTGIDLPQKNCPKCGADLHRDGHDIPFEVFLGFEGDKEPDIDLNFAGNYQPVAHKYVETLFGRDKVLRAGTIGTIQGKTAFGYVKAYMEEEGLKVHPAEERRLMNGIIGVKRASSQHPGGIMIVPQERHIHDFTPIQYPADSSDTDVITTHFSYKSIHESILKLDILGHDAPMTIRHLEDMTGIHPDEIPMQDPETMAIFSLTSPKISTLGIPEFGTGFVQEMLSDTRPTTFGELVRISGLSHGTDVWLGNAKDLIDQNIATLKEAICTRDDIMRSLILQGLEKKDSFTIMENVRKGRGLKDDMIQKMRENDVPEWYIESCQKIKYMFPKAHAVAYVLMSYRIAWFKVHHPAAFYASYFTIKIQDVPKELLLGEKETNQALHALKEKRKEEGKLSAKEDAEFSMLTVGLEMFERGLTFAPIDLYTSPALRFDCDGTVVVPPLRAVPAVSEAMACDVDEERKGSEFTSQDDLMRRTRLNKTALEGLRSVGALEGLPETNQLSFF